MGTVEWLLVAFLVIYLGYGASRLMNRPDKDSPRAKAMQERAAKKAAAKAGTAPAQAPVPIPERRPSLLVSAWNASGAKPVTATRIAPAVAELTGRAIGSKVRTRRTRAAAQTRARADAAHAAVRLGQTITTAARRRWEGRANRSQVWRRAPKPGTGSAATVAKPGTGAAPADDQPVTATVKCGHCGTKHTLTIQPGEIAAYVTCPCGADLLISRRPLDQPSDPTGSNTETQNTKENPTMTIPAQRPAAPAAPASSDASQQLQALAPPDWAAVSQRIADFEPESDADLLNLMTGEVAGICGYAESYETLHERCVQTIGLDPTAVQGLGEFSDHVMELTQRMNAAHEMFLAAYREVMQAVSDGVVLPYNGRFFTGQ